VNKSTLVTEVAKRSGVARTDVAQVLDATLVLIHERVARGQRVSLAGFGTFERVRRNPRLGRNPHTREAVRIPARNAPSFRASAAFRQSVAGRRRKKAPSGTRRSPGKR
jgi:DNA-binding protein HU-beta